MRRTITVVTAGLAILGLALVASAQVPATLTLKSGQTISGDLIDLGGVGFTVRVNGQDQRIPTNRVRLIDFGGKPSVKQSDLDAVTATQHLFVMKNSSVIKGELDDIGGTRPLRITIRTGGGTRDITSSNLARIYLARPPAAAAATTPATPANPASSVEPLQGGGYLVTVSARQTWTDTTLFVVKGSIVSFQTTGEITLDQAGDMVARPAGEINGQFDWRAPLPKSLAGALIGRIGNGQPFGIGDQTSIPMPATGQLFLGVNDSNVGDNGGAFHVTLHVPNVRRRR